MAICVATTQSELLSDSKLLYAEAVPSVFFCAANCSAKTTYTPNSCFLHTMVWLPFHQSGGFETMVERHVRGPESHDLTTFD